MWLQLVRCCSGRVRAVRCTAVQLYVLCTTKTAPCFLAGPQSPAARASIANGFPFIGLLAVNRGSPSSESVSRGLSRGKTSNSFVI